MSTIVPPTTDKQDEIVALAGDWHGSTDWAQNAIMGLARAGATRIYHLGDFGIWPGDSGARYLRRVNLAAERAGIDLWVTPGNHEDYDQIAACPVADDGLQWIAPHIALIPRGHRWTHGGREFVSLGGAPSIDFEHRTEGASWWRAEMVTGADVVRATTGGHAHVALTHDAPDNGTDAVQAILDTPPDRNPWSAAGLRYAAEGRVWMNELRDAVEPVVWAHGHYHAPDDTKRDATRFLSLGCDGQPMNVCLLRLSDLAVSWDGQVFS